MFRKSEDWMEGVLEVTDGVGIRGIAASDRHLNALLNRLDLLVPQDLLLGDRVHGSGTSGVILLPRCWLD